MTVAVTGVALNLLVLLTGAGLHTYIYLTEVPEGYTRVHFSELQQRGQGPEMPTERAVEINGESVFLKGYIHPASGSGLLKHFILVPDLGTCCFGGQPRSSDMIEVTLLGGQTIKAGLETYASVCSIVPKLAEVSRVGTAHHKTSNVL